MERNALFSIIQNQVYGKKMDNWNPHYFCSFLQKCKLENTNYKQLSILQ